MKKVCCVFIGFILTISIVAQTQNEYQKWLEKERAKRKEYVEKRQKDYNDYRNKRNAAFTQFLKKQWTTYQVVKGVKKDSIPKPTLPIKISKEERKAPLVKIPSIVAIVPNSVPNPPLPTLKDLDLVLDTQVVVSEKKPSLPKVNDTIKTPIVKPVNEHSFIFLGQSVAGLPENIEVSLSSIDEEGIAQAWHTTSKNKESEACLKACIQAKEYYQLCDWAYIELCKQIPHSYSNLSSNQVLFLQAYLLAQTGFEMRLARQNEQLLLLMPTTVKMYSTPYFKMSGARYYIVNGIYSKGGIQSYDKSLDYVGHHVNLRIEKPMKLASSTFSPKELKARKYPWVKLEVSSNKSLIDFYKSYPQSDWSIYPQSVVEPRLLNVLDSVMPTLLGGLSSKDQINSLLNFVQTAFKYQTDDDQFGREKPFFIEETFYYPYCDCEDRSTLFAFLVKRYLKLDVLLINYPNHMATAVNTKGVISGDYLEYKGNKYTICDPTFINAPAGKCMPQYKTSTCHIYPL